MKKMLLLLVLTALTVCSFSQVIDNPAKPMLKADYLKKSKSQKTTAWVLLGTGAALDIIALATFPKYYDAFFPTDAEKKKANTSYWLLGIGSATMLASIPFTVSGHANKKKAASMSIDNRQLPLLKGGGFQTANYPALTMKITF